MKNKTILNAGEVALVGSGPGDAELLTLRALHFIQQAEVVVYDRLVSNDILELLPINSEKIYVGKKQANHSVPQNQINQLLVEHARRGKKVVRLKGGDPFVFGRGGEEAEALLKNGINCHLCPGVTAASGCTTYAGIPLTHRGIALGCTFVTGHMQNDNQLNLPWGSLVAKTQTVVFYMGINTLPTIAKKLIEHGRDIKTPVALIQSGTKDNQKTYRGNLSNIAEIATINNVIPPTLIVVGEVVNQLTNKPLAKAGYLQAELPAFQPDSVYDLSLSSVI